MKKSILPQMRHLYSVIFAALLVACGSSKGVGYADGIYNDSPEAKQEAPPAEATETSTDLNTQYYKNYFADTAQEVEDINGNSEVFTDVDSYSSNYTNDSIPPQNFTNNGGWGSSTTEVVINNYNSGWAGGIGFSFGFAWGGWYGPGWGWGYYPPPFYGCYYPPYYAPTYGYGYTYVNSYRGNIYVADYGRSGRSGTRSLASNSIEARRSSLASRDRRGRSVTRLTEPRLNTDITRSTRNTVASNNRATRSARSVPGVRNSRSRSYSSNPSRSYSSRNSTSARSSSNSRVRSNQSSSRYNSTNSRARSTTRSTYNRGSSTPSTRSYSAPRRSSSSSSRGSMSRSGGSRGSSGGGARGGRGGRG